MAACPHFALAELGVKTAYTLHTECRASKLPSAQWSACKSLSWRNPRTVFSRVMVQISTNMDKL